VTTLLDRPAVRFSDLQREPRAVSHQVDQGPVRVTRRDGAPLVLIREDTLENAFRGIDLASQILGIWLAGEPKTIEQRLAVVLPWVIYLSDHEQSECAREMLGIARACAATNDYQPLLACAKAWQSTAEAYAAGWDGDQYDWLPEPIIVSRPHSAA